MSPNHLSSREREVVDLISQGLRTAEAAQRLYVTPNTVKAHLKAIYRKLDVHNRVELLACTRDGPLSRRLTPAQQLSRERPRKSGPLTVRAVALLAVAVLALLFVIDPLQVGGGEPRSNVHMTSQGTSISIPDQSELTEIQAWYTEARTEPCRIVTPTQQHQQSYIDCAANGPAE